MKKTITTYRFLLLFCIFLCSYTIGYSQSKFTLPEDIKKDKISFKLINNLVIIPVNVNGVTLSFLLDTGVGATIMFSLSEVDSLELKNTTFIRLRGFGGNGSIRALKSKNNTLKIGKATDSNHTVFVIFEESLNLSLQMGVPIHGILGYDFFKDFIVKTDYNSEKLTFYNPNTYVEKRCKKCEAFDLVLKKKKPYLKVAITNFNISEDNLLLIDSGSSDAIWLFDDKNQFTDLSNKYFEDFLGQGLSGSIFGKRAKLTQINIGSFRLEDVKVAYPEKEFMKDIVFFKERKGSLGGEILKRFTVITDYSSKKIVLKKNGKFKDPFHYNMSGLVLKHDGVVMVKEKEEAYKKSSTNDKSNGATSIPLASTFNYYLVPKFVVSEISKGSPAALVGIIKDDEIITVNGKPTYKYELAEIIGLFSSKAEKKITLKIKRNGINYKKKFYLKERL